MKILRMLVHSLLLVSIPLCSATPIPTLLDPHYADRYYFWNPQLSYDDIIDLIHDIESKELAYKCPEEDIEKIVQFVVAMAKFGFLPGEDTTELERDSAALLEGNDAYFDAWDRNEVIPLCSNQQFRFVLCKSWFGKRLDVVGRYCKKHKKALIITGSVVVGALVAVGIASAAGVGAVAGLAGAASDHKTSHGDSSIPSQTPQLDAMIQQEVIEFKNIANQERLFDTPSFALEETGKTLGSLFSHHTLSDLHTEMTLSPLFAKEVASVYPSYFPQEAQEGHIAIDDKFSTNYAPWYIQKETPSDLGALSHLAKGEQAMAKRHFNEAIGDFSQAIFLEPTNPQAHLDRGIAHFGVGDYQSAKQDLEVFSQNTLQSAGNFSLEFAKALPQGIYESSHGLLSFLGELAAHPIETSKQMWQALSILSNLAREGEWSMVTEAIAPEAHELIQNWENLTPSEQGESAGYLLGKYGADVCIPGAVAKIGTRGVKAAQGLSLARRALQNAEKTLLLESTTSLEHGAQVAKIMKLQGQISEWLGEQVQCIRNKAGDPIFVSQNGTKKVRFDFNKPHPHENPHVHFEELIEGEWKEITRVYPSDLPHR